MAKKIVLAILDADSVETAVNNFVEAEFNEKDMSLVMQDTSKARNILTNNGSFKGINVAKLPQTLKKLGVSENDTQKFLSEIKTGKALFTIAVDDSVIDSAKEMLKDYNVITQLVV
jgi:PBP1b-binding outer membrane lipoprotein LpoB